jgi:hypothetical protein
MPRMADQRLSKDAALLLQSLGDCLVWLDEDLLLATVVCGSAEPPPLQPPALRPPAAPRRLGFRRVGEPPRATPRLPALRRRLRFSPMPAEVDRVVVQNWNAQKGYVPVGDVEVELDPGQAVTLWINRSSATPVGQPGEPEAEAEAAPAGLLILGDEDALLA